MSSCTRKVVVKHFSGAKTKDMKSYIIPTVDQKPDNIILHTGANDLNIIDTPEEITMGILNLAMTCKTDTNSVFISGIVPRSDKLNEKASKVNSILRHECNVRNICFIDNKHISPRFHCNRSGLHLNYYGTKKLQENFLYELAKLDWQFDMVGMYTLSKDSIRVRNKNKGKRKKNKKVDSRNSVEESSYEHIGLSSNNSNESFLSESSDTLNNDLIGLSKQRLTYPKNLS